MSYLYNLFEGSLADLEQRVRNAEPPNTVEALEDAVDSTWQGVHPIIANLLDWHEQEALLEQAANLPGNGPTLVSKCLRRLRSESSPTTSVFKGL
jgi:hypothetical protein